MPDEKTPSEDQAAAETLESGGTTSKAMVPTAVAWVAFVIIALFGVLIATVLRNGPLHPSSGNSEIAALQAELDALRGEQGDSETVENIADRLKKDADSLVALAGSYQKMLGDKDGELTAGNAEILRSEKLRQSQAAELAAARQKLQMMSGGASAEDYADLKRRFDETLSAKEFFEARVKALEGGPSK